MHPLSVLFEVAAWPGHEVLRVEAVFGGLVARAHGAVGVYDEEAAAFTTVAFPEALSAEQVRWAQPG